MPSQKGVETLLSLCNKQIPFMVKNQVTGLTNALVEEWWNKKEKHEAKRKWKFTHKEKITLASGRVREMEEVVVGGDEELDFEFKEDIDQYDLTHIELDSLVNEKLMEAVVKYRYSVLASLASSSKFSYNILYFREYLMEWPVVHIVNNITASVFKGIEEAIVERNSMMHMCDKPAIISKYNMEMFLILKFLDVILVPNLDHLDLREKLQPVRNHVYDKLHELPALQMLNLGDASHGYTPDIFQHQFLAGVEIMNKLVIFCLHFDCFDDLIASLGRNCSHSLKVLDIELSKQVTDSSIEDILKMSKLVELHIFSCGFTNEGQCKLLKGLQRLVHMKRSDFLCEALDWVDWYQAENGSITPTFNIQEFHYSESYHFHTAEQMKLVSKYCPNIVKMRFMFNKQHFITYQHLNTFKHIKELHLCGGEFYSGIDEHLEEVMIIITLKSSDYLLDLLEEMGGNLTDLDLYAVDELDMKAIAMISIYCKKLGGKQYTELLKL